MKDETNWEIENISTQTLEIDYEAASERYGDVEISGAVPLWELQALVEIWRKRGVIDPYGMTWIPPADELQAVIGDYE
jgi:hypothetical protein